MTVRSILICLAFAYSGNAADLPHSDYRARIDMMRARLQSLEAERQDYRKKTATLEPPLEAERLVLMAQLSLEDPLGYLVESIERDIHALASRDPIDDLSRGLIPTLKELLTIVSAAVSLPKSQKDAQVFGTELRALYILRDVGTAKQWLLKHQ